MSGCSDVDKTNVTGICRSCKPYFERGSWHFPQTHYEYDEVGLASWYGPGCHGKKSAAGQIFNTYELTAAHKTLPLPSIVRVTNLDNNKSLDVLVHDRGPYVYEGRIIDLSIAAAKKLNIYQKGIGRVRVQTLVKESKVFSDYLKSRHRNFHDQSVRDSWIDIYNKRFSSTPVHTGSYEVDTPSTSIKKINYSKQKKTVVKNIDSRFNNFEDFTKQLAKNRKTITKAHSISNRTKTTSKGLKYAKRKPLKGAKSNVK